MAPRSHLSSRGAPKILDDWVSLKSEMNSRCSHRSHEIRRGVLVKIRGITLIFNLFCDFTNPLRCSIDDCAVNSMKYHPNFSFTKPDDKSSFTFKKTDRFKLIPGSTKGLDSPGPTTYNVPEASFPKRCLSPNPDRKDTPLGDNITNKLAGVRSETANTSIYETESSYRAIARRSPNALILGRGSSQNKPQAESPGPGSYSLPPFPLPNNTQSAFKPTARATSSLDEKVTDSTRGGEFHFSRPPLQL